MKDQDVQAGLALAARVSNQIWFGCNMWTVNRSCDPTLRGSARNGHIFQLVIINFVLIAFAFEHLASGVLVKRSLGGCDVFSYSRWVPGGLRVLDVYANHFEVLGVIMDQDVQAGLALAARVSNQIVKSCNMWTVNRSRDPTFVATACNAGTF